MLLNLNVLKVLKELALVRGFSAVNCIDVTQLLAAPILFIFCCLIKRKRVLENSHFFLYCEHCVALINRRRFGDSVSGVHSSLDLEIILS